MTWATFIITFVCVACNPRGMLAEPSHAASTGCGTPNFGDLFIPPQSTPSPFVITVSSNYYVPDGDPITVTLQARCPRTTFRGFLLSAGLANPAQDQHTDVGSFDIPVGTQRVCGKEKSRMHTVEQDKSSVVFQWIPPHAGYGNIVFTATFEQSRYVFWVDVHSEMIKLRNNLLGMFSDFFNSLPKDEDDEDDEGDENDENVCSSPQMHDMSDVWGALAKKRVNTQDAFPKDAECGTTKGCFSECVLDNCDFLMSWAPDPNTDAVNITLKAYVGDGDRYMAFGLSTDTLMEDDSVTECVHGPTVHVRVFNSWNQRHYNMRLGEEAQHGLKLQSTNFEDGVLTCYFSRSNIGPVAHVYNLTDSNMYYIFLARGYAYANGIYMHDQIPFISSSQVSLQNTSVDITSS